MIAHRYSPAGRSKQSGSFLLEALVSVLIVAFGILGIIGLQARSMQNINDAQYRSEAVYLASTLIGLMWVDSPATLSAEFGSVAAGPKYDEFKTLVAARLPGADVSANDPIVTVTPAVAPATGTNVEITIFWQPPGEASRHNYVATATICQNAC